LKLACSVVVALNGTVKTSGATILVDPPLHALKVQVASAVAVTVMLLPSAYWPAGQSVLTGLGVPTVPQPAATTVTARHGLKVAVRVTGVAGMVNASGLLVPV